MRSTLALVGVIFIVVCSVSARRDDQPYHQNLLRRQPRSSNRNEAEKSSEYWMTAAQMKLKEILKRKTISSRAKNVILFLGDGMSFSTVAATRMYMGGEEVKLSFEKFPNSGFSKTYCVDAQVADSACTATAYLSGVKTNYQVVGLNAKAEHRNCSAQVDEENLTESILSWAQKSGKGTGIVTTTRITHASPAGTYAHSGSRYWENDAELVGDGCDSSKIDDIAEQLVYNEESKKFKVILGGGRGGFRSQSVDDEEGHKGHRLDGRDLIEEWKTERSKKGRAKFVHDRDGLSSIDIANTDYVLGLFEPGHMKFNLDYVNQKSEAEKPSLAEMTITAINMLQKEENGFFLFVEGGMIDQAHHYNYAQYSLDETKEFSKAIEAARNMTRVAIYFSQKK